MKCRACKKDKPHNPANFQRNSNFASGLDSKCKPCTALANKGRYKKYRKMRKIEITNVKYIDWPPSQGFEI